MKAPSFRPPWRSPPSHGLYDSREEAEADAKRMLLDAFCEANEKAMRNGTQGTELCASDHPPGHFPPVTAIAILGDALIKDPNIRCEVVLLHEHAVAEGDLSAIHISRQRGYAIIAVK